MKTAHRVLLGVIITLVLVVLIIGINIADKYQDLEKRCFEQNIAQACAVLSNQTWVRYTDPDTGLVITPQHQP